MTSYKKLERRFEQISNFRHLSSIASWDEAVNMPEGGGESRSKAMSELSVHIHSLFNDPVMEELLNSAETELSELDGWQAANLKEMRTAWLKETAITEDLVKKQTEACMRSEQAWRSLRPENNWKDFAPLLEEVVKLAREEASQRSEKTGLSKFDAMMELYQEDVDSALVDVAFEPLHEFLPDFVQEVVEKQKSESVIFQGGTIDKDHQQALAIKTMEFFGFDFKHGRLDTSHHPFCGGVPEDVRLTTRYDQSDFMESFMSVIHETGHASYDQGLPCQWSGQPVGGPQGMAVHEGQSLLFEMQVGRSQAFIRAAAPILAEFIGNSSDPKGLWEEQNLVKLFTRVMPGYIRVSADEVTYPSHIMLRYEIEKGLIDGSVQVSDIPDLWDQKMQQYLGLRTEGNYKDGCMQDAHWPAGAFGYFPSYTLGAMVAAQLFHAIEEAIPSIHTDIESGDLLKVRHWLTDNVWSKGCSVSFDDLLVEATGETLNSQFFIRHLRNRYS